MARNAMNGAGFRDRLFLAWSLWQGHHGRKLTQAELGIMLGKVGGNAKDQTTISDWFRDVIPKVEDLEYLAKALDVDPGWLAFGSASQAPKPSDLTMASSPPTRRPRR